jgi:hypothetical protein
MPSYHYPFHSKTNFKKKMMAIAIILFVAKQIKKKMMATMPSSSLQQSKCKK